MPFHRPQEESLDAAALHALQRDKLARMLVVVRFSNPFYREKLAGVDPDAAAAEPTRLPLTTRAELQRDQEELPPYGTNLSYPRSAYVRMHQTSGSTGPAPLRWLDTAESWDWCLKCWSVVYRGAGLHADDRLVFPFSFGPFLGFWMAFEAACRLGNFCLAAGGMSTAARLRYLLDNGATVVCCTPTYALHLAETAAREGIDLARSAVRMLIVAGEPGGSIPSVRRRIEEAWGARVIDHAGMTETGAWGFECAEAPGGMHVIESEFIAEVLSPQTLSPVADGTVGELVLTNLGRIGSPLIRYRTGDLVRLRRGRCACGRGFARVEGGVLGRIDDMLIVRGNNVFPSAVEGVLREIPEVAEFRLTPTVRGAMTDLRIEVELAEGADTADTADAARRIVDRVRDRLNFAPTVEIVESGALPRFEMKARRVRKDGI
ncbi:MAG: phenylacetate--CoA ligase [Phycisphaerae bacterium]|nr:MAG: phenylacetate--CoA ligase [Phycisphaerae bacterium]